MNPYPLLAQSEIHDGSIYTAPEICRKCKTRQCSAAKSTRYETCSYGFDFIKHGNNTIIGILIKDGSGFKQKNKRISEYPNNLISFENISRYINQSSQFEKDIEEEIERKKEEIIRQYVSKEQYKKDFLKDLSADLNKSLSFFHDYKQINSIIRQNINVLLIKKYGLEEIDERVLSKATANEVTIYYASQILEEKLKIAKALLDPEWLYRRSENTRFRVHGLVVKYLRMYEPIAREKKIQLNISGYSITEVFYNSNAVSIIPQTFIDNAIKYSPQNEQVTIYVNDEPGYIDFSVTSYGPKINDDELEKIFQAFYRGREVGEEEGAGYGLYIAQMVAVNHIDAKIEVRQNTKMPGRNLYNTIFSIKIPQNLEGRKK